MPLEAVTSWLEERRVPHEVVEHAETFAAADEARASGFDPRQTAKTLALHEPSGYRLAVIPASARLDVERARGLLGASGRLRLATEEEMGRDFPDFEVGAIPPFGPLVQAPEVVDVRLLYRERLLCAAGDHRHSLVLDPRDLIRLTEPLVGDICEHGETPHDEDFEHLPHL